MQLSEKSKKLKDIQIKCTNEMAEKRGRRDWYQENRFHALAPKHLSRLGERERERERERGQCAKH